MICIRLFAKKARMIATGIQKNDWDFECFFLKLFSNSVLTVFLFICFKKSFYFILGTFEFTGISINTNSKILYLLFSMR